MQNLFVIGSPRSGTTFLASLLEPTAYGAPFETQFILKYSEKLSQYGDITQIENLKRLVGHIASERAVAQWGIKLDARKIKQNLGNSFDYADVVNEICISLVKAKKQMFWGDKTPHYILKLNKLLQLFPNAKYLYIVRDGRDVALSLLQKNWGPNNAFACAKEWSEANNADQLEVIKKLEEKGKLLCIHYETLLEEIESECRRIYAFLGEDIESHRETLNQLIKKVISGNYSKWKTKMNKTQIIAYESVAKETLKLHGYEVSVPESKINYVTKIWYRLQDRLIHTKHMFSSNVIDGIKIKFFGKQPFNE